MNLLLRESPELFPATLQQLEWMSFGLEHPVQIGALGLRGHKLGVLLGGHAEIAVHISARKSPLDSVGRAEREWICPETGTFMSKMAKPTKEEAVAQLLEQLPAMNHKELQQHWMELFGREPSLGMRRNHMIPILAYRAQEKAFGGLKESTVRMLRELALGNASEAQPIYRPKTGTRYVREHNGKLALGTFAFWFKKQNQVNYGLFEIVFGIACAFRLARGLLVQEAMLAQWASLVGAAYVVSRGHNNIADGEKELRKGGMPLRRDKLRTWISAELEVIKRRAIG